jgi:hypothetical protein
MGICGFKYHEEGERLECYPFNFYILPYTFENLPGLDKSFTVSIGSFQFLAKNKFDFNRLFYESVGYLSHHDYDIYKRERAAKGQQQAMVGIAGHDSPDCTIYCNSQFLTIKTWLDSLNKLGSSIDLEKDERNQLKIEVSFTRAKLFQSLMRNLPKMFPKDLLDCELMHEENSLEIYLLIRKTTPEIRKKMQDHKIRSERYLELQRFIHSKSLHGQFDAARDEILAMVSG